MVNFKGADFVEKRFITKIGILNQTLKIISIIIKY